MRTIGPRRLMDAATEKRGRPRLRSGAVMTSGGGFARHWPPGKILHTCLVQELVLPWHQAVALRMIFAMSSLW